MKSEINQTLIDEFESYLMFEKKYSKNTISSYKEDLIKLDKVIKKDFTKLEKKDIQKYIQDDLKDLNPSSISRTISTLKSFYKYLKINNQIKINPMQAISRPKKAQKLPKVLSDLTLDICSSSLIISGVNILLLLLSIISLTFR